MILLTADSLRGASEEESNHTATVGELWPETRTSPKGVNLADDDNLCARMTIDAESMFALQRQTNQ